MGLQKPAPSPAPSGPGSSTTILSANARFVGDLVSDEDIHLAGAFEGKLHTSRSVVVAPSAHVQGEIQAVTVLISGRVDGPVLATDRIELQPGAIVNGDLCAQHIRMQDNVIFNGGCRMTEPEAPRRQYLLPALVQGFEAGASPDALVQVQRAAERFLHDFGFDVEVRPDQAQSGANARPIFRSREPMPYAHLREKLRVVERALQTAASAEGDPSHAATGSNNGATSPVGSTPSKSETAPQATGADGARALVEALGHLRSAALLLGPVIVTQSDEDTGPHVTVRVRQDSMPTEASAQATPEPSNLLASFQKLQSEVLRDLSVSAALRAHRNRTRG